MTSHPKEPKLPESLEAIRAALDAGPTPGPWGASFDGHGGVSIMSIKWQIGFASKAGGKQDANAALIAACNPKAITALLDALKARDAEIERLRVFEADALRYRWLRETWCFSILERLFGIETSRHPCAQLDAAIDQARATGGEKKS